MPSFKAPTGETTSSRIKTLVLHVERTRGRAQADAFLEELGLARETLQDETSTISLAMVRRALEHFVRRYGRDALTRTVDDVVHASNLGPWIPVVRTAETVAQAYRLLEGSGSFLGSTTQVEGIQRGRRSWRGRMHVLHDPSLEDGGLLSLARRVELAALPVLFGREPAVVRDVAALDRGDRFYEYDVSWREPSDLLSPAIGAVLGAVLGTALALASRGLRGAIAGAVLGAVLGAAALWLLRESRVRRSQVLAQSIRIRALERSLELQEHPTHVTVGDLEGQVIAGLYRLHARLGSGATGVIYEAMRLSDRTTVAVKLLRAAVAQDSVASDRLAREAEALRLTWHPNVVELHDHGHLPDGTAYLVMERLRGETLATRISRQKFLTAQELYPIVMQICDALSAMHAAGVVHRDLKPSNVFLCDPKSDLRGSNSLTSRDPSAPHVKVFDFGIARVEWAETRITNMGVPLGTPGYMPPEQEGGEVVDRRADIYALGALIYESLTGRAPPLRWPPPPAELGEQVHLDPAWLSLVEKAMSPDRERRFNDARALALALQDIPMASGTMAKSQGVPA